MQIKQLNGQLTHAFKSLAGPIMKFFFAAPPNGLMKFFEQPLTLFPLKLPVFPFNSQATKINLDLYQYFTKNSIQQVAGFVLRDTAQPRILYSLPEQADAKLKEREKERIEKTKKKYWENMKEEDIIDSIHLNLIYDDNVIDKMGKENEKIKILSLNNFEDVYRVGSLCKIKFETKGFNNFVLATLQGKERILLESAQQKEKKSKSFFDLFYGGNNANTSEEMLIPGITRVKVSPLSDVIQTNANYQMKQSASINLLLSNQEKVHSISPINMPDLIFRPEDQRILDLLCGFLCLSPLFSPKELQELFQRADLLERAELCRMQQERYEKALTAEVKKIQFLPTGISQSKKQMEEIYNQLKKSFTSPAKTAYIEKIKEQIKGRQFPANIKKAIDEELSAIEEMNEGHHEQNQRKQILELLVGMPFGKLSTDSFDLTAARQILDADHFGLDDVKQRILEFLAVSKLKGTPKGKIFLLVGPPGVGKTSIASSIAKCMGRKFARISLGGEYDVAVIKGHRKTQIGSIFILQYIIQKGAYPGRLVQAIKNAGTENPVILIDEIDKIGRSVRGNIQDALLEALDPEQNFQFHDHYLDSPIDLSKVLFICSANLIETIYPALYDRMEVIQLSGQTMEEKRSILKKHLLPKSMENIGLQEKQKSNIYFEDDLIEYLIDSQARESGVRNLERLVRKIIEKIGLQIVLGKDEFALNKELLAQYIGLPTYSNKRAFDPLPPAGISIGLAQNANGGAIMQIETMKQNQDKFEGEVELKRNERQIVRKGKLQLTGSLGNVMNESVQIAQTYAKFFCLNQFNNIFLEENDVHIHFPEGSTRKDGPSAGIAIATALISLALKKPMENYAAMTGEITLTGQILKIGGVKEKILAAKREKITTVILPLSNKDEIDDLKEYVKSGLQFIFVEKYIDVAKTVFKSLFQQQQ